jgi:hypothetical protein
LTRKCAPVCMQKQVSTHDQLSLCGIVFGISAFREIDPETFKRYEGGLEIDVCLFGCVSFGGGVTEFITNVSPLGEGGIATRARILKTISRTWSALKMTSVNNIGEFMSDGRTRKRWPLSTRHQPCRTAVLCDGPRYTAPAFSHLGLEHGKIGKQYKRAIRLGRGHSREP